MALLHVKYFNRTMLENLDGEWNVQIKLTVANNLVFPWDNALGESRISADIV